MTRIPSRKFALVIDDSEDARMIYSSAIKSIGFDSVALPSIPNKDFFEDRIIDLILLDLKLGHDNSIHHIKEISKFTSAKIVIMTAFGCIESAVEAVRNGASGFFLKSDPLGSVLPKIQSLFQANTALDRVDYFLDECGIIGKSKSLVDLAKLILQVGPTSSTVLIHGSSGSGKELIAQALHKASNSHGPFVAVNCSAIPEQLLESELFGAKRGAYTDAKHDRRGVLDSAAGGTIFLDEIGELQLSLQAKLLRVIQECEFTPVGGTQPIKLRARIICATNRNLIQMVHNQTFREDLYYRIAVITLHAPNLCERSEDIPMLIEHFLAMYNRKCGKTLKMPTSQDLDELCRYQWPGNIRELQNAVERATVLGTSDQLDIKLMLPLTSYFEPPVEEVNVKENLHFKSRLDNFERDFLKDLLRKTNGNLSEAARVSGIYRANIYRMARRLNMPISKGIVSHEH